MPKYIAFVRGILSHKFYTVSSLMRGIFLACGVRMRGLQGETPHTIYWKLKAYLQSAGVEGSPNPLWGRSEHTQKIFPKIIKYSQND